MFTEGFEQFFKTNKNLSTPLTEWNKTYTEMCRRIAQKNIEQMGENVSRFSEQLKQLSNMRKPEDFIQWQKECLEEEMAASMEYAQEIIHTSMANMEELTKLCKSTCGTWHESTMTAAKTATKNTERTAKRTAEKVAEKTEEITK
ncbi:MAG: phasin family protein [Gammaproteobacteria bacterium]|nr:MAG: phasin family protein [Gammaproteobacteria bacterium]